MRLFACFIIVMLLLAACGTSPSIQPLRESKISKHDHNEKEGKKSVENTYPQLTNEVLENEKVIEMETTMGAITIKLFPEYAPKTVENFITHSRNGYYNGLIFHRVIKDFMVQGGDPKGNGTGGESIYGKTFEDEFSTQLFNFRGALSMANAGLNTNGSQFFIVQSNTMDSRMITQMEEAGYPKEVIEAYRHGGTPWLDHRHTVFGQVIEGMDVVDKITNTPVDRNDKPKKDVHIKKIHILD